MLPDGKRLGCGRFPEHCKQDFRLSFMRNLLWSSARSASAILASSALHCNSKRSSDSDSDVRARHMGQVIRAQHD
jgi:hypothetical protein